MNRAEADQALAITSELGFEATAQEKGDGTFRVMTFDPLDRPRRFSSLAAFVERYGTVEQIRERAAAAELELAMDRATADQLSETMLELCSLYSGRSCAPISALPDRPARVSAALLRTAETAEDEARSQALMLAQVDLAAFIDEADIDAQGSPASERVLAGIKSEQAVAIVVATGVNVWRAETSLPARIGEGEAAVRAAIGSQAGYDAAGVPAVIHWLVVAAMAGAVALGVAIVTGEGPLVAVIAFVCGVLAAFPALSLSSSASGASAADAALEGDTPRGRRSRRVMAIVGALPAVGPIVVIAAVFIVASRLL